MKQEGTRTSHGLIFHWPQRSPVSLTLVGFFFLSLLAHALAFYIFQVAPPTFVTISPPPAQVSVLAPNSPENQSLMRWIDSEDPSAMTSPHEIVPAGLQDVPYQTSFAKIRTAPKPPVEKTIPLQFPPAQDSLSVINSAIKSLPKTPSKPPLQQTNLRFSDTLSARKIVHRPAFALHTGGAAILEPASFLIGVARDGKVIYTSFMVGVGPDSKVQNSSGDKAVDQAAEDYLAGLRFSPARENVTWGVVTFLWGSDIYQPIQGATP